MEGLKSASKTNGIGHCLLNIPWEFKPGRRDCTPTVLYRAMKSWQFGLTVAFSICIQDAEIFFQRTSFLLICIYKYMICMYLLMHIFIHLHNLYLILFNIHYMHICIYTYVLYAYIYMYIYTCAVVQCCTYYVCKHKYM